MSITAPRYKPTEEYIVAALNLCRTRVDEINLSIRTIKSLEKYDEWYQGKLEDEYSKIVQIKKYPQCANPVLGMKIETAVKKCMQTSELLEEELAKSLCKRIEDYTISLHKCRDEELASSYREITKSFIIFRDQIEDYEDDSSSKAQMHLRDATTLLDSSSELIDRRLSGYDYKQKGSFITSVQSLLRCSMRRVHEAPLYHPTKEYYVAKALYRKARIDEIGACLNQQKAIGRYVNWFQNTFEKESYSIERLVEVSKNSDISIADEIAACRAALTKVEAQFQKKVSQTTQ